MSPPNGSLSTASRLINGTVVVIQLVCKSAAIDGYKATVHRDDKVTRHLPWVQLQPIDKDRSIPDCIRVALVLRW